MAEFHFIDDYVSHVRQLIRDYPLDKAMSLAVGGDYERVGSIEADIMQFAGLRSGHKMVDFGCGSGRLASNLASRVSVEYVGLDVVQELLDYAKTQCPPHYEFKLNTKLTLPIESSVVDFFSGFSVFTHLLHAETYLYLEEMMRCLKPGGRVVASFLEFALPIHWAAFASTVEQQRTKTTPHLNQFIERSQIRTWTEHLGFASSEFIDGSSAPWRSGLPLGQSVMILTK